MEERILNTHEALKILKKHYITDEIQMVTRFIRNERLKAERDSRKNGWRIREEDLYDFIEDERPGMVEIIYIYDRYIESLFVESNPEPFIQPLLSNQQLIHKEATTLQLSPEENKSQNAETEYSETKGDLDQLIPSDVIQQKTETSERWIQEILEHPSFQAKLTQSVSQLKEVILAKIPKQRKNGSNEGRRKYEKKTFTEFIEVLKKALIKPSVDSYTNEELNYVYQHYYDENNKMKEGVFVNAEKGPMHICLETNIEKQQFIYLLRETVPLIIKKWKEEQSKSI
ncbi:MAG: hypothetical protein ACI35O_03475 [Bacillaceae bacterium]